MFKTISLTTQIINPLTTCPSTLPKFTPISLVVSHAVYVMDVAYSSIRRHINHLYALLKLVIWSRAMPGYNRTVERFF